MGDAVHGPQHPETGGSRRLNFATRKPYGAVARVPSPSHRSATGPSLSHSVGEGRGVTGTGS